MLRHKESVLMSISLYQDKSSSSWKSFSCITQKIPSPQTVFCPSTHRAPNLFLIQLTYPLGHGIYCTVHTYITPSTNALIPHLLLSFKNIFFASLSYIYIHVPSLIPFAKNPYNWDWDNRYISFTVEEIHDGAENM